MTESANVVSLPETWSVVVLYEDRATRDRAMSLCDRLVQRFWSEVEFDFHWWRTDFLTDAGMAQTAEIDAAAADILIFSSSPASPLSPVVVDWFGSWSARRPLREGMLLDLSVGTTQPQLVPKEKQFLLRELARKAGLEYFNRIPASYSERASDSLNTEQRARQVTVLLEDMLKRIPPPSHFGLNE